MDSKRNSFAILAAVVLLLLMVVLAGGAALRESITVDELAHIGSGVTYLQKFDLRFNEEHPPLPKIIAALPLVLHGVRADYSHISWTASDNFFAAFLGEWVFGEYLLSRWNNPQTVLVWARAPMLLLTLILGYCIFVYARRLGGNWAGLVCLAVYVTMPAFLTFAALVHTDIAVTLFILLTLWRFADLWQRPNRKNALLFALCLAGALLSKFTAGILFFVFLAFALSTRWLALPDQPTAKADVRAWRRLRWRFTLRGILWAAIIVYAFYFIFSLGQPTDSLSVLGHNPASLLLRRLLMAPWLYLRGVFMVLFTSSRATFILGRNYPHGVWFYFPVIFVLKTPLGFLGLLLLSLAQAVIARRRRVSSDSAAAATIPAEHAFHWRCLWVGLLVFLAFCLLSRLDLSIRHFTVPLVLLILLLAPLPRALGRLRIRFPRVALLYQAAVVGCVLNCLFVSIRAYPYFFPYINSLSLGRPAYALVNDSNLDWNQSLPEARRFAEQHGLQHLALDYYGLNDPTVFVPQAQLWNCQTPSTTDSGQWVVVSASMIMDGHNCLWLMQFPHEPLAGGSMYAVHLPDKIPQTGAPGGPPLPVNQRQIAGGPLDMRPYFLEYTLHPEKIPQAVAEMQEAFKKATNKGQQKSVPSAN